jgi:hypothetical protein
VFELNKRVSAIKFAFIDYYTRMGNGDVTNIFTRPPQKPDDFKKLDMIAEQALSHRDKAINEKEAVKSIKYF